MNALVQLKREDWIVRLADRAGRIRARAEELGIGLVEDRFRFARLAAFESRLEDFWRQRRRCSPILLAGPRGPARAPQPNR